MRRAKDSLVFSPYYSKTKQTKLPPSLNGITLRNFHYVAYPGAKYNKAKVTFSGYRTKDLVNPLLIQLDNVQYDHMPILRNKHHHDIEFTFGPGPVKNLPLKPEQSIVINDTRKGQAQPLNCSPEGFKKFPSAAAPI